MKVKDVDLREGIKVIDPNTGKIGFYRGSFDGGVFLSMKRKVGLTKVYAVNTSEEDFEQWELAPENLKPTINTMI